MSIQHAQGYCDTCKKTVLGQRDGPNHVLHAILMIFTCCLWAIPWLFMSTGTKEYACPTCGSTI
jgi:hypothetical protein